MKYFIMTLIATSFLCTFGNEVHSRGSEVHTKSEAFKKMHHLLVNKLKATPSQIKSINDRNRLNFSKLDGYYHEIGRLKAAVLEEVFSNYHSNRKLDSLYAQMIQVREKQHNVWVRTTKSIWGILKLNKDHHSNHSHHNKKAIKKVFFNHSDI